MPQPPRNRRSGFSYLEMQVSMALFFIALAGIAPLSVMQSRQVVNIERRVDPDDTHYITPSNWRWARKLGGAAFVTQVPLDLPNPNPASPIKPITLDDGDADFIQFNKGSDDWTTYSNTNAYGSDYRVNFPDSKGDEATWVFKNLPSGMYTIWATYPTFSNAATNVEYDIFEDSTLLLRTKKVDQTQIPDEFDDAGRPWKKLANVKFFGTDMSVTLSDKGADGYIVVDAIRIFPKSTAMEILSVTKPYMQDFVEVRVQLPKVKGGGGGKGKGGGDDGGVPSKDKGKSK